MEGKELRNSNGWLSVAIGGEAIYTSSYIKGRLMMHRNGVAIKWYSVLHSASLYYMLNSGHHISNITRQYKEKKKKNCLCTRRPPTHEFSIDDEFEVGCA